jgi:peptide/nickel transport system permease protein
LNNKLDGFRHFCRRNSLFVIGSISVILILFTMTVGPSLCTHDPNAVKYSEKCISPCAEYPFGTDFSGRCVLCRVIYGAHISIGVALVVVVVGAFIGVTVGIVAGYAGGAVDSILMRLVEIMLSFPGTIFALAVLGTLGNGTINQIIALTVVRWAHYARLARGETLTVMNSDYIQAAQAIGNSRLRIIVSYIFPNIIGQIIVIATLSIGPVILAGAALSYLGLGAQIPSPEWGLMINGGKEYIRQAPWITLAPGMAAVLTVFAFNLLGEGIGDMIDPRLKEKAEAD